MPYKRCDIGKLEVAIVSIEPWRIARVDGREVEIEVAVVVEVAEGRRRIGLLPVASVQLSDQLKSVVTVGTAVAIEGREVLCAVSPVVPEVSDE